MSAKKLIVFTDLDGCFLDHSTYEWQAAAPALADLERRDYPLIFASSKTFSEIRKLRIDTNNHHPAIIENGGAVSIPENYFANRDPDNENYDIKYFAKSYSEITSIAHSLRAKHGYLFCGFSDMSIQEICKQTSLDENAAADAKAREATEPILWNESEARLDEFHKQLNEHGLKLTRGGRFFHIMSPVNKGQAVNWLLERYREHLPDITWVSMALGDSENDIEMLQQVDYPVLVKNPYAVQPELSDMDKLVRTRLPGPHGWNEAVLSLISKLK